VLNAAALSKPQAIEHLAADLASYNVDVGVITETHFKTKHSDSVVGVENYTVFRRDRVGRRGGGVALYVRSNIDTSIWTYSADNRTYELHWVRIGNTFVAALYHPPAPAYNQVDLLDYIEGCVTELSRDFPMAPIVLAGDMNQLPDQDVVERTGLTQIVLQPTRGNNTLDKVYVSDPQLYSTVRVVTSVVRSDHRAIVVYADQSQRALAKKTTVQHTFRPKTPNQHALFLQHVAAVEKGKSHLSISAANTTTPSATDAQTEFDSFYSTAISLLNQFYPQRTTTVTSRDPLFITPEIKVKLRRKNRLMRAGRTEEAGKLAERIGKDISRHSRSHLKTINGKTDAKDMWTAVRQLTGRQQDTGPIAGITAESLNSHYATISTDSHYMPPINKQSTAPNEFQYISTWQVFKILDNLHPTATGLDQLPAWFLRVGAPYFYEPVTRLFNLSLKTSTVPKQWKQASIRPIPKISSPTQPADFRPISITPVLTRLMERTVVQRFLYPALQSPPPNLLFTDQFAFRPSGSPAAAIISLLNTVTSLLLTNPYVIVISLDFSKAFDTVRHSTLLEKLAQLDIPDQVYNWMADFFTGHEHCTVYQGQVSTLKSITASIIQGSGIGPAAYVVTAGDLKPVIPSNQLCKFADDTYLIVPASNIDSRTAEIVNIETWARTNNLTLNRTKTKEIVFRDNRRRRQVESPPSILNIDRVTSLKVLGVTITNGLSASDHVRDVIKSCAQTQYALRVLRAHGMGNMALQAIFRSVVVAKLLYASSAWSGFISAADRQRVDAYLRRSKSYGYCPLDLPPFEQQCTDADQKLFDNIQSNNRHLLYNLLPPPSAASQNYNLRPRPHNQQLPQHTGYLTDSNFITRMLFKDVY